MIIATDVQVICNTFYACNTNFIGHTTKAQALAADKDKWKCLPSCANTNDDVDMEIQEGDGPSGLMENKVPDDEMVNQTIARSEEEFELFQRMDMERRSAEADLGAARKPRLIEETELPDFLIQDPEEIEQEEKEEEIREAQRQEEMGRGNRSRKEVTYQEQLSERDWLKAIGAEDEGSSDDNKYAELDDTPSKNKKKKKRREHEEEEPVKKRKKGNKRLCKKMKKLIEVVMQYEDSDGRVLSEPFYKLPSRKELPDYYEVRLLAYSFPIQVLFQHLSMTANNSFPLQIIKKPVDIAKIQQRIDDEKYEDMSALQKVFSSTFFDGVEHGSNLFPAFFRTLCSCVQTPNNTMRTAL